MKRWQPQFREIKKKSKWGWVDYVMAFSILFILAAGVLNPIVAELNRRTLERITHVEETEAAEEDLLGCLQRGGHHWSVYDNRKGLEGVCVADVDAGAEAGSGDSFTIHPQEPLDL